MRRVRSPEFLLPAVLLAALVTPSPAQRQFAELNKRQLPIENHDTRAVAIGDVDGDGDLDLVCSGADSNRLYLNDGDGIFTDVTAQRLSFTTPQATCAALGDVDGDGDLDLVCGTHLFGNRLYLNDGHGTFTDVTFQRFSTARYDTLAVAFGDFDGDGDLDLVCGNQSGYALAGQNRLYLNDGTGTFVDVTAQGMPYDNASTTSIAVADVDGDGDLDFVSAIGTALGEDLYRNDGTGRFTLERMPGESTRAVVLGDVDGDGDPDLICGLVRRQNRLYLNDGTGTFTDATDARMPAADDWTTSVVLGDVDGDGDLDLCFADVGQSRLYVNDGTGTFSDGTDGRMPAEDDQTSSVVLGDVDGDGDLDLVSGAESTQNRLYLNDGRGAFADATAQRIPCESQDTRAVVLGDVDGDGDLDLVCGTSYGASLPSQRRQNVLWINDGRGTFTDATDGRMPMDDDATTALALGDVDGDGDLDLVVGNLLLNGVSGQNRLYLNDGSGNFTDATARLMPVVNDPTAAVALGDVDGDGDLDLVCGNAGQNRLYANDGHGAFTDVTAQRMPVDGDSTTCLVLLDVDRDGDLDVVWGNNGQDRLYLNDGHGTFTDGTTGRMPLFNRLTWSLAAGDVDNDGDVDLVCGGRDHLYRNDGTGTFTDFVAIPSNSKGPFFGVALGDVDHDGDLDLVCGTSYSQTRLYLNDGRGFLTDATAQRMPAGTDDTLAVALADVDGDGDLDLICGNFRSNSPAPNRIRFNLHHQLDTPFLLRPGRTFQIDGYATLRPVPCGRRPVPVRGVRHGHDPLPTARHDRPRPRADDRPAAAPRPAAVGHGVDFPGCAQRPEPRGRNGVLPGRAPRVPAERVPDQRDHGQRRPVGAGGPAGRRSSPQPPARGSGACSVSLRAAAWSRLDAGRLRTVTHVAPRSVRSAAGRYRRPPALAARPRRSARDEGSGRSGPPASRGSRACRAPLGSRPMTSRLGRGCVRRVLTASIVTLPIGAQEWTSEPSFGVNFSPSTGLAYDSVRARTVFVRGTETWEHDGAQWRFRNAATPTGPLGIPLLAFDGRRGVVVMLVGDSSSSAPAWTWEWNGARWQRVQTATAPPGRWMTDLAYDSRRGVCVLYGGDSGGTRLADTWAAKSENPRGTRGFVAGAAPKRRKRGRLPRGMSTAGGHARSPAAGGRAGSTTARTGRGGFRRTRRPPASSTA